MAFVYSGVITTIIKTWEHFHHSKFSHDSLVNPNAPPQLSTDLIFTTVVVFYLEYHINGLLQCSFVFDFFNLALCFRDLSVLLWVLVFHSLLFQVVVHCLAVPPVDNVSTYYK